MSVVVGENARMGGPKIVADEYFLATLVAEIQVISFHVQLKLDQFTKSCPNFLGRDESLQVVTLSDEILSDLMQIKKLIKKSIDFIEIA
jgi:hypothetical protein